jgi:hypothetical protein
VRKIARTAARRYFLRLNVRNKNQMAQFIAATFRELARRVPPERKPWMSEDSRMAIFDVAGLALAFFRTADRRRRGLHD